MMTNWLNPNPFHTNPTTIIETDGDYNISLTADRRWKPFVYRYEVPDSVLKSEFDWLDEDAAIDGFFKRKGTWHHQSEFERVPPGSWAAERGWEGVLNYSMSNGLVIKRSDDGEEYQVGYYYLTSEGK